MNKLVESDVKSAHCILSASCSMMTSICSLLYQLLVLLGTTSSNLLENVLSVKGAFIKMSKLKANANHVWMALLQGNREQGVLLTVKVC